MLTKLTVQQVRQWFDLILSRYNSTEELGLGMHGPELFRHIKTLKPRLPVIIITGYLDSDIMARALKEGPFGVMNKPLTESDIVNTVNAFIQITKQQS